MLLLQRQYNQALEYFQDALQLFENSLGKEHPLDAYPLTGLGNVHMKMGNQNKALSFFKRVLKLCRNKSCEAEPHGKSFAGAAKTLLAIGGDKKHAIQLARQAEEVLGKAPYLEKYLEAVKAWKKNTITLVQNRIDEIFLNSRILFWTNAILVS